MEQHEKQQFEKMVVSDAEPQICATEKKLESVSVQAPSMSQSKLNYIIPPLLVLGMVCTVGALVIFTAGQQDQLAVELRDTINQKSFSPQSSPQTNFFSNETLENTVVEVAGQNFQQEFEDLLNRSDENLKDIAQKSAAAQNNGDNGGNSSQPR